MKSLIIAAFCLTILVQELAGAPVNTDYKNDKKQLVPGTVTSYGQTEVTPPSFPSNYNANGGASYADPCVNTGYNTGSYNTGYNTGYNSMGIPCSTYGAQDGDVFNRPVELVAVKDFNVKNGKVVPPTNIIQG